MGFCTRQELSLSSEKLRGHNGRVSGPMALGRPLLGFFSLGQVGCPTRWYLMRWVASYSVLTNIKYMGRFHRAF